MKNKLIHIVIILFIIIMFLSVSIYAVENDESKQILQEIGDSFGLDNYVSKIEDCMKEIGTESIDLSEIKSDLLQGKGTNYGSLLGSILKLTIKEVISSMKGAVFIFVIILFMAIMSGMSLENDDNILKIAQLVCFIAISGVLIVTFKDTISLFQNTTDSLSKIMQIVSPFVIAILIGTGAITTTGIIQPILLFISSTIGFVITYVVIPLLTLSTILNIVSSMCDNFKFSNLSKMFNKGAIWIVGVMLTLFLGILSLETSISSSVDSLTVNVTQAAVSNFIPVVGKFFSDSLETVIGATKIISKTGGVIGIITILAISIIPILKIFGIMIVYMALTAICEPICKEDNIIKFINSFTDVYKSLLGILIGIDILFVISIGIILNLCSKIVV